MRIQIAAALALVPALLAGQSMQSPRPQLRCAAYDSLMSGAPRTDPGSAAELGRHGSHLIPVTTPMRISELDRGITGMSLTIRADSGATPAQASIQLNVFLSEPNERSIEERQGLLIVDDTLTIEVGSMSESPGDPFPNGTKTWFLYGPIPRGHLVTLARAKKLEFKAGSTRYALSEELMKNLRGGLAAFVCRN